MGQCFSSSLWPLQCFGFSLHHDSGDGDQTSRPSLSSTPLPISSSRHHDSGDEEQTSRLGSSSTPQDYEVFLSFRGEDTRCGFTDHLYHGLDDKGIRVFRDDERLRVGEKIDRLLEAIKASKISVPIISADYASSMWCLRELLQIIECNKTSGQLVLPIFYKVKPSDVREQKGVFGKKFRLCRKNNDLDGKFVQDLQNAFEQVASMKGWESDKIANGHEGALVRIVVRRIFNELRKPILSLPDLLVGVDEHIEAIKEKFDGVPSNDAKIIVIHGMGGIGKTTLAKALYNKFFESFECQSFVANIREASSKDKGMKGLQKQMISDILGDKSLPEISYVDEGKTIIENSFKAKRLLLVLDDVRDRDQLDNLAAKNNWFGSKSIVIITTRNKDVIAAPAVNLSYELNELNDDQSYKLFCKHAFGSDASYPSNLETIVGDIVSVTGGLPLAIEVIGSLLHGKGENFWRATKEKLRRIPNSMVHDKLKISYDALDYAQKQIFLDIACFSEYVSSYSAFHMWKSCEFYPEEGIEVLVSLSLIKVLNENDVVMHDQLKYLGREIVRNESRNEIGKRSRLCLEDEAKEVIKGKQGTGSVQALHLDLCRCTSQQFEGMANLRFLRLRKVTLIGDFESLFLNLRWLYWFGSNAWPGDIMEINFNPKKLVVLRLRGVHITEHWKGWSQMKDLKILDLDECEEITMIPDLSALKELEHLELYDCESLMKIHPSIGQFSKTLKVLRVLQCHALEELPVEVGKMEELRELTISGTGIKEISISDGYMQKLETFSALGCKQLISIPDSIWSLLKLQCLAISSCRYLMKIPESIGKLKFLNKLNFSKTGVTQLPNSIGDLCNLKEFLINHTPIKCFPTSFGMLSKLQELDLEGCRELESLSNLPCNLRSLKFHGDSMETLHDISNLTILKHLTYLDLFETRNRALNVGKLNQLESLEIIHSEYHCLQVGEVLDSQEEIKVSNPAKEMDMASENFTLLLKLPSSLVELEVFACQTLCILPSLSNLNNLLRLELKNCFKLMEINDLERAGSLTHLEMQELRYLDIRGSGIKEIPILDRYMQKIETINASGCKQLISIPDSIGSLLKLQHLNISSCRSLMKIPESIGKLKLLTKLDLRNTGVTQLPDSIGDLYNLKELLIDHTPIKCFPTSFGMLEKLQELDLEGCWKLESLSSLPCNLRSLKFQGDSMEALIDISNVTTLKHLTYRDLFDKRNKALNVGKLNQLESLMIGHSDDKRNSTKEMDMAPEKFTLLLELPSSLVKLEAYRCQTLHILSSFSRLKNLSTIGLKHCSELMEINILEGVESLTHLNIESCVKLSRLGDLSNLKMLKVLNLHGCEKLSDVEGMEKLTSLTRLLISGCSPNIKFPDLSMLKNLEYLRIMDAELMEIPWLQELKSLTELTISSKSLQCLPNLSHLTKLSHLDISNSEKLIEIRGIENMKSLMSLSIKGCTAIRKLPDLSHLTKLTDLGISNSDKLTEIRGIENMKSLRCLSIKGCTALRKLPDLPNVYIY